MSELEPSNVTPPASVGPSAPSSDSSSPSSSHQSDLLGRLTSLAAFLTIVVQWFRGEIPAQWALAGLLISTLPAGLLASVLVKTLTEALSRFLPAKK